MHTAKELHDEQCFREWLAHWRDHAANAPVVNGYWQRIERALSLLASVEGEDGIVRRLLEGARIAESCDGDAEFYRQTAALIVSQREKIERVKAHAEAMANSHDNDGNYVSLASAISAYRAAHPKDGI